MNRDVFVYLSGPITAKHGYTVEENVAAAVKVYLECLRRGIPAFCPHLSGAFPSAFNVDYETWIAYDFAVIERCTHVMMLPRWETSAGAVREKAHAEALGCAVVHSLDELS
jgi:hypothetical protein